MIPAAQALLHFLWQGTVLAAGLAVVLRRLRNASASDRHALACATLTLMAVAPVATFFALKTDGVVVTPIAPTQTPVPATQTVSGTIATAAEGGSGMIPPWILPWITAVWIVGVAVSALRLLGGAWRLHRWATRETSAAPSAWQERCDSLGRQLGLRRLVPLRESARVHGPLLVGWFRPMLVLPLGMLQSLPGLQIEALLLHELAHVHGRDPLIHLLQRAVETLLFYHPAVWWVSEQIRREREHRCDDRVIEAQGEGHSLAEALVTLAERAHAAEPLALAATDGSVGSRVRRLLQGRPAGSTGTTTSRKGWLWITGALVMVCLGVALGPIAFAPRLYVSTARVRMESPEFDPYRLLVAMETVKSTRMLTDLAERHQLPKRWSIDRNFCVERLRNRLRVTPFRNTLLLEIQVADEDPNLSAELANGVASDLASTPSQARGVEMRLAEEEAHYISDQLATIRSGLGKMTMNPSDPNWVFASTKARVLEQKLEETLRKGLEIRSKVNFQLQQYQVIDDAVASGRPIRWKSESGSGW
jgi:beta-lactamase regulating signal transducer with metallopeptidase domain